MKRTKVILVFLLLVNLYQVKAQTTQENLIRLQKAFLKDSTSYNNYENLQLLLTTHYEQLSAGQRKQIRTLLDKSIFSNITTYPPQEAGSRIVIKGIVTDKNGKAIPSAKITFFQTDAKGYYAPPDAKTKRMSESDARLYGVLRTNKRGEYELNAIRPASYPIKYEGRSIPQHIHFNILAKGYPELKLQVVFDNDPAMKDEHWRNWAKDLEFPIVKLTLVNGKNSGICNVILKE